MSDLVLHRNKRIHRYFYDRDKERFQLDWKMIWEIVGKILKWTLVIIGLTIYEMVTIPIAIALVFFVGLEILALPMLPLIIYSKWEDRKFSKYHTIGKQKITYPETPEDPIDYNEFWNNWDYFDNFRDK